MSQLAVDSAAQPANWRIGEFLKVLDLTEGRSTGISKILNLTAAPNGSGVK